MRCERGGVGRGVRGGFFREVGFFGKKFVSLQVEKGGDRDSVVGCFLVARSEREAARERKRERH